MVDCLFLIKYIKNFNMIKLKKKLLYHYHYQLLNLGHLKNLFNFIRIIQYLINYH
jgi:hypothetical protein